MDTFESLIATFSSAGIERRSTQVQAVLTFAENELKKRDLKNPDIETLEIAQLKIRSLNCDKLLRSHGVTDSKLAAEVEESFGWVLAGINNLCLMRQRADLLDAVNASA